MSDPPALEAVLKPRSPLRLPRRSAPDGVMRFRGGVLSRLLHVDGVPVVVRAWQDRSGDVHLHAHCPRGLATKGRDAPGAASPSSPPAGEALEMAIERMRFCLGVDDDLMPFYAQCKNDKLIGPVIRRKPWLRPRRRPVPWEALAWAITGQLIEAHRAAAIQRRMVWRWGIEGSEGLRDVPPAPLIAGSAPAELAACDLAPKRAIAMRKAAREVATGRVDLVTPETDRRLLAIPEIGPWTVQLLALGGRGDPDALPAGDLGFVKLVGCLAGYGRRASVEEVEEFFAPYEPYRGLAGNFALTGLTTSGSFRAAGRSSAGRPAWAAAG